MAKRKTQKAVAEEQSSTAAPALDQALQNNELVAEAAIDLLIDKPEETVAPKKEVKKSNEDVIADVVVLNSSYSPICISDGKHISVTIAPKEMKRIPHADFRELMKQKMVRAWFDKGVLSSNGGNGDVSAHEAEVPVELKGDVVSRDGENSVSAGVKKFEKDRSITINL